MDAFGPNALPGAPEKTLLSRVLAQFNNTLIHVLSATATVPRDGRRQQIPAEQLVLGDIVVIEAGDRVPADLRLVQSKGLRVEEAALTGESVPSDKDVAPVVENTPLADRSSMAFSGTLVSAVWQRPSSLPPAPRPRSAVSAPCSTRSLKPQHRC